MSCGILNVRCFKRAVYTAFLIIAAAGRICAKDPGTSYEAVKLLNPELVSKFYELHHQRAHWYTSRPAAGAIRDYFLQVLDSCRYIGLTPGKYHYDEIRHYQPTSDSGELIRNDRIFTDAITAYCKDLYCGFDINKWISNDEVSSKFAAADNDYILKRLINATTATDITTFINEIEPVHREYLILKNELKDRLTHEDNHAAILLANSLNYYRWIHHFHFDKCIVVNIAAASLRYYEHDELLQQMKVVVGKPSTRSPRFATWCYEVVLYPYWNVPRSIAAKELFPRFKKNPALIKSMNMQVIGSNGKVIDHTRINWAAYDRYSFPFSFRQCTGCDNALGVIKFNLTDPFNVYLHDTNYKLAFLSDTRFMSHGCIRVEKPIDLGNHLLNNKLDSNFLKACITGQKPVPITLEEKVPVFIIYAPAGVTADSVVFHKDIYGLYQGTW